MKGFIVVEEFGGNMVGNWMNKDNYISSVNLG